MEKYKSQPMNQNFEVLVDGNKFFVKYIPCGWVSNPITETTMWEFRNVLDKKNSVFSNEDAALNFLKFNFVGKKIVRTSMNFEVLRIEWVDGKKVREDVMKTFLLTQRLEAEKYWKEIDENVVISVFKNGEYASTFYHNPHKTLKTQAMLGANVKKGDLLQTQCETDANFNQSFQF